MLIIIDEIEKALQQLAIDAKPLWGKMSAHHMVEHLKLAMSISSGEKEVEIYVEDRLIPVQKRFLLSNKPLPKLFINPAIGEDLLPLEYKDIDSAKAALMSEINKYESFFVANPDATPAHPVFGKLNKQEWDLFHKKHFEHHFSQFGINI